MLFRSLKVQLNDYPEVFFPPTREVLSEERKHHSEGLLSSKECLEALNGMATEKTPGTDGPPCEFYSGALAREARLRSTMGK